MDGKVNVLIRGKAELTKKRHQIDVLLKRAMKGNYQSKDKLYKEFGIRVYSSDEVQKYVNEKLRTKVMEESPVRIKTKIGTKTLPRRKVKLVGKKV
jgi:thiaminase